MSCLQSASCTSVTGTDEEVQILKMSNATYDEKLPAQHAADTAMFVIDGHLFLAVANEYNSTTGRGKATGWRGWRGELTRSVSDTLHSK